MDLIPGSGRPARGGHGNPFQCPCLENPMDRGAWQATVHVVTKSWTQLKRLSMHKINLISLVGNAEKAMAPHSSTLAWKIPRMAEPGGLRSMGSLRVGHD